MTKYSFGGQVVADSLIEVGLEAVPFNVSLVETTRQRALEVVLVQNAWNVIPWKTYWEISRPYQMSWKLRAFARRVVSLFNLWRAKTVLCLTPAMASLTEKYARGEVVTIPVAAPVHMQAEDRSGLVPDPEKALVVGTITWYKRPDLALEVIKKLAPSVKRVLYVGIIDDLALWEKILQRARELKLDIEQTTVPNTQMPQLYAEASVTVLPSELESLGFAVVEAMKLGNRVLASDIPAHRDAAWNLGGTQPEWFDSNANPVADSSSSRERISDADARTQWEELRDYLLRRE